VTKAVLKKRAGRFWNEWVRPLLVLILVLGSLRSAVADWNDVPSRSMEPTILPGDRIFVNKLAYDLKIPFSTVRLLHWADPQRGDIVVLWSPYDGKRLVKRVVAVPGDLIEARGHRLTLNGKAAQYAPFTDEARSEADLRGVDATVMAIETVDGRSHAVMADSFQGVGASFPPVTVPPGKYFLMGDHRDDSFDSRFWGFADRDRIVGRASAVALSFDFGAWRPRWKRFFSPLS
jgi:signal peptidase I